MQHPSIGIIGGGLAGLTAAYELHQALPQAQLQLWEADERIGGKLHTEDLGYGPIDVGAEAFLGFRADTTAFMQQLDLGEDLVTPSGLPSMLWLGDGTFHPLPRQTMMGVPPHAEAISDLVDEQTQQRIAAESDQPLTWDPNGDVSIGELVAERMGQQVVDNLVSPLLGGVYSSLAGDLGLRATVPQLAAELDRRVSCGEPASLSAAVQQLLDQRRQQQEKRAEEGVKPAPVFRSFRGGYQTFLQRISERCGAEIYLNSPVQSLQQTESGWLINDSIEVDAVVVATPAPIAGRLLQSADPDAAAQLREGDASSSAVVAMAYESDEGIPDFSGILISPTAGLTTKAFTFSSKKWPHIGAYGGAHIRASFGRYGDTVAQDYSDEQLIEAAIADFETMTGVSRRPDQCLVQRWIDGIPRYRPGYTLQLGGLRTQLQQLPGLAVAGAGWSGVGVPACITSAQAAAAHLVEQLGSAD